MNQKSLNCQIFTVNDVVDEGVRRRKVELSEGFFLQKFPIRLLCFAAACVVVVVQLDEMRVVAMDDLSD